MPEAIDRVPLDALKPYPRNTRTHSKRQIEQIARTLDKDLEYFIGTEHGEPEGAPPGQVRTRERIMSRIMGMSDEDLPALSDYLDFLTWRRHHG